MRDDQLRARLRQAARDHSPDRERMLARIERGTAEPPPAAAPRRETGGPAGRGRRASWPRVVGVAAAVTGVLVAGGYGAAQGFRGSPPAPDAAATAPEPSPDTSRTGRTPRDTGAPKPSGSPEGTGKPDRPETSKPSGGGRSPDNGRPRTGGSGTHGPRTVPADELLWADGSIDPGSTEHWSQSDITVKAKRPLAALTVELRLSPRDRPRDTGNWRTRPADDFEVTVRERDDGGLVYRWTLKEGRTVPPGEHVFAGQYDHDDDGGRDANDDAYSVRAATAEPGEGERAVWKGGFA